MNNSYGLLKWKSIVVSSVTEWLQWPWLSTWFPSAFMSNIDTWLWIYFYCVVVCCKNIRMILALITHWMVQWKPEAAAALSATKLCWSSNLLCAAFCCNINFINITASSLPCIYEFFKTKSKWKCYQNLNSFFIFFKLIFIYSVASFVLMLELQKNVK